MTKLEKVQAMVDNGYNLFNETVEEFAARWTNDLINIFYVKYMDYIGK